MARVNGTIADNALFGTNGRDLIRGFGGNDHIQSNGGNDRVSGSGDIDTGRGNDSYYSVRGHYENWLTGNFFTDVEMGAGNDLAVLTGHDPIHGTTNYAFGIDVDLGGGRDTIIYGAKPFADTQNLGSGADTAYILSDSVGGAGTGGVRLSLGGDGQFGIQNDRQSDTVHLDSNTPVTTLYQFGENDQIVLYGTDMTMQDVRLRTTFIHNDKSSLIVTLDNGSTIEVVKGWQGYLGADNLTIVDRELSVREKVLLGNEATLRDALFLSGADNGVKAKGKVVFAGAGDDAVRGDVRNDVFYGDGGDDRLVGNRGHDLLDGGTGDDRLLGGKGRDFIYTGAGEDFVSAGRGSDEIIFSRGGGTLKGGAGRDRFELDDVLVNGDPDLKLKGGSGADTFAIESNYRYPAIKVLDFRPGQDVIELEARDGWGTNEEVAYLERLLDRVGTLDTTRGDDFDGAYIHYDKLNIELRGLGPDALSASDFIFA